MPVGSSAFFRPPSSRPLSSRSRASRAPSSRSPASRPPAVRTGPSPLQPTPAERVGELLRPGWARTVAARRAAAAALVLLAAVLALRSGPDTDRVTVVVAAHDLTPGTTLTADDLALADHDAAGLAPGVLTDLSAAVGNTLAGPVPAGEPLVDVRMLGPRLAAAATGHEDARVVPIRLADAGVGEVLREGDRVDVLTVAGDPAAPTPDARVLARGAVVVLSQHTTAESTRRDRVVLVALEPDQAVAVAAASLVNALTVTLH